MRHSRYLEPSASFIIPAVAAPRRGLSCDEAASYIGLGQTKFLALVDEGKMPKPIRIDRRVIWDVRALDVAFDLIRDEQSPTSTDLAVDEGWGDEAP